MYHSHALVESQDIGDGTRIWAFAHVMQGAKIGSDCNIGDHVFIESGAVIGNGVTIKNGVSVWDGVTIGDGSFIGPNAVFTNDLNPRSPRLEYVRNRYASNTWLKPTCIEEGVTIGANATIICGIHLGAYSFVAAGAVITRDVRPHALMLGSPARERGLVCRCAHTLIAYGIDGWSCSECDLKYDSALEITSDI